MLSAVLSHHIVPAVHASAVLASPADAILRHGERLPSVSRWVCVAIPSSLAVSTLAVSIPDIPNSILFLHAAADGERREVALKTVRDGRLVMQGPMMLSQGYFGVVGRKPVYIKTTNPNETFG
jgi:hypothetical protein